MRRMLLIVISLSILLANTTTAAPLRQDDCSAQSCVYLPAVAVPQEVIEILPNHSWYTRSNSNYIHIVGEVQNDTITAAEFVKVSVNVFNGAQLVSTDYTYTTLDILRPGDKTCFDVLIEKPAAWTSYQFETVDYNVTTDPTPNLALLNTSSSTDQIGAYHIIGQVRNDAGVTVTYVQPIGTLYDAAGMVLDCDFTFVNSTDLNPGQTSAFDMLFFSRESYTGAARYRVQVNGNLP